MKKKILLFAAAAMVSGGICAHADVLGDVNGGWSTYMGAHTYFHNIQYASPSVGSQSEYYVEYTPNSEAVPVVVNGKSIWGTRDIEDAEKYMRDNGLRPLAGINADYFSFRTGIPMGYTIIDGEIVSKEYGGQDALGFRADGTGFIKWLDIQTTLSNGNQSINIMYINKWLQPGFDPVYMLNDKFSGDTKTESECIFVMCTPISGKLSVGGEMKLIVDDVFIYNGAIEIPDGKQIFVMDVSGDAQCYDFLSHLAAGNELTLTNEAVGDDGTWAGVSNAVSSVGGRLINNGTVNTEFEAGAAPRTAVGIKPDGNIIFYTIDGRQPGHSYGVQLSTLAKRMSELGCIDAINLDGGGSTTISALFPGSDSSIVVNSPSDGYLRNVSNFIFLRDNRVKNGIPWIVNLEDAGNTNYLSGMSTRVFITSAYDTSNYKIDPPYENLHYRVDTDTDSTINEEGYLYLNGTGSVNAVVYSDNGDLVSREYTVFETPEEIKVYNQADWKEVDGIYTAADEEMQLSLSASALVNNVELNSNNRMFTWEVEGDVGTITPDGIFTLAKTSNKSGKILVRAGETTTEIPVVISDYPQPPNPFADTEEHWARDIIAAMAGEGIISGQEEDGRMVFKPDNNMTRAEFASMIVNYIHLDLSKYESMPLNFLDAASIPLWAQNAVKAANSEGIILGRINDDGTIEFAPNDNITRAEAITVLGRIIGDGEKAELEFADAQDIPSWAEESTMRLYAAGVIHGYEGNLILPLNNIRRAEAAVMLYGMNAIKN